MITTSDDPLVEFEALMDEAANICRGRQMTEDEWIQYRQLWAGVGMTLAPCRPDTDNQQTNEDDDFDRAMKGFV